MAGWPIQLRPTRGVSLVGDDLSVMSGRSLTDTVTTGEPSWEGRLTTITADGTVRAGTAVPMVETCCGASFGISAEGIAYGVESIGDWDGEGDEVSRILALAGSGAVAGWPVSINGVASGPAFGPDGRILVTVGSFVRSSSRVLTFDSAGQAFTARSAALPIRSAEWGVDCVAGAPPVPVVAGDGTTFLWSEMDPDIFALDRSLAVRAGWPYRPPTAVEIPDPWRGIDGLNCSRPAVPTGGPDGSLHLPLQARNHDVGGAIVAVGTDGRIRRGWPVELKRAGSEFWSVVVGADGTAYALAIEPESGGRSSASVLAIAPDSTVAYATTIIDP